MSSEAAVSATPSCEVCGGTTHETELNVTLWDGDRLVVVEDVPAAICDQCQEQFYDERSAQQIKALMQRGFPEEDAVREISVPVFRLGEPRPGGQDVPNQ